MDIAKLNSELEAQDTPAILRWARDTFGEGLAVTSSFQTQSVPLLHMIAQEIPKTTVYFLDTGFHFAETLQFRDTLIATLGLNVHNLVPEGGHTHFLATHGELHQRDTDACCRINKVEPLDAVLPKHSAWITGIRRDQTPQRANTAIVASEDSGRYKIAPMVAWTQSDIESYMQQHALPTHPLHAQGYLSIGCAPCTKAVRAGEDARAGRWAGQEKTECGLHYPNT